MIFFQLKFNKTLFENPRTIEEVQESNNEKSQRYYESKKKRKVEQQTRDEVRDQVEMQLDHLFHEKVNIEVEQKISESQPELSKVGKRELIATLVAKRHLSITQAINAINDIITITRLNNGKLEECSDETVSRIICEMNAVLDLKLIEKLSRSSNLGWNCDETPNQRAGRSFFEITVFGTEKDKYWEELLVIKELCGEGSKTAANLLEKILIAYEELKTTATRANMKIPALFKFNRQFFLVAWTIKLLYLARDLVQS